MSFMQKKDKKKIKSVVMCTTVGVIAGSESCNYCVLRKKCGALKRVNTE